jgi:uncharacterized cupredoxin-like copper-binding protein
MKKQLSWHILSLCIILVSVHLSACTSTGLEEKVEVVSAQEPDKFVAVEKPSPAQMEIEQVSTVEFTLVTAVGNGRMSYVGRGGEIDGVTNPDLLVKQGDTVRIILKNGDFMQHDLYIPDFDVKTPPVVANGDRVELVFEVKGQPAGVYAYFCTFPGHRQAGQEGKLVIAEP